MASFKPVTAVTRALDVLRVLNELGEAAIGDLHRATGLHKSTVLRMLETLMHEGYVARMESGAGYVVTGKCLLLSAGYKLDAALLRTAEPLLTAFRRNTGWPSDLAVFDQDAMVIASTNREFGTMSLNRQVGARVPMLMSSLGRAYLAFCACDKRDLILERLTRSSNPFDSPAKQTGKTLAMLAETRARGYAQADPAYADQVYKRQISGFSAPVIAAGEVAGAVNIMFYSSALTDAEAQKNLLPGLLALARDIGDALDRGEIEGAPAPRPRTARKALV